MTCDCLELVNQQLMPLKHAAELGALLPQEHAILQRVEGAIELLLAKGFESYSSLSESTPSGILEGGVPGGDNPPAALLPAVELCGEQSPCYLGHMDAHCALFKCRTLQQHGDTSKTSTSVFPKSFPRRYRVQPEPSIVLC